MEMQKGSFIRSPDLKSSKTNIDLAMLDINDKVAKHILFHHKDFDEMHNA